MSADQKGRIRLSWAQIAWAVGMIVAILATWGDLRVGMARVETKLDAHAVRIAALEARNEVVGFTKHDAARLREDILDEVGGRPAHASTRPKPRK